jgi:Skp family chaperone for outer membrane proteins
MSVSGISSNDYQSNFSQIGQFFSQLGQDLQAGGPANAQSIFAQLQQDLQTAQGSQPSTSNSGSSTINADITTLGQDLQSGNLTDAQTAFAQLQQDIKAAHGHHHHHGGAGLTQSQTSGSQGTGANSISADMSALGQALGSNNSTNAQSAFTQLQQDFQNAQSLYGEIANLMTTNSLPALQTGSGTVSLTA